MTDYTIVPFDANNVHLLHELYRKVYNKRQPAGYFKSKYDTGYTGVAHVGYFALLKNRPVAFYGVIPVFLSVGNKKVLGAQSCDTMTAPSHQGRGLFTRLAEKTFELAKEKNIQLIFGFANARSFHGFISKLGFTHLHNTRRYVLEFEDSLIKKLRAKFMPLTKFSQSDGLGNQIITQGFDGLIYSPEYFNYKRFTGNFFIGSAGSVCWCRYRRHIMIGGCWMRESFEKKDFTRISELVGAATMSFMISPGTVADKLFNNLSVAHEGLPVVVKSFSPGLDLSSLKFQSGDMDIF